MNLKFKLLSISLLLTISLYGGDTDTLSTNLTIPIEPTLEATSSSYTPSQSILDSLNPREQKSYIKQLHRDSIRANKKVWLSFLGGPSYTPNASFGIGGAVLASFKTNKDDSISYRSFLPAGVSISVNGTIIVAGAGTLFFNENRFRIYATYGYRNEPSNYFGKGMEAADTTPMTDSTTAYTRQNIQIYPRFIWEVKPAFYLGTLFEINYSKISDISEGVAADSYFQKYASKYTNIALGGVVQYDTRDDVATPNSGMLLSATAKVFSRAIGGTYNYQLLDLEYRQFQPLFKRAILGWVGRAQMGFNDIPFTDLPSFGTPFDLRGFYQGQYRDRSMAYAITEFRHMFGTEESAARGSLLSKFGYVAWVGTGTLGDTPKEWEEWKLNYGVGLRVQIQPRKNFRLDLGKAHGEKGVKFYLNMTEAF